jgi:hypothetical protein
MALEYLHVILSLSVCGVLLWHPLEIKVAASLKLSKMRKIPAHWISKTLSISDMGESDLTEEKVKPHCRRWHSEERDMSK